MTYRRPGRVRRVLAAVLIRSGVRLLGNRCDHEWSDRGAFADDPWQECRLCGDMR